MVTVVSPNLCGRLTVTEGMSAPKRMQRRRSQITFSMPRTFSHTARTRAYLQ